MKPRARKEPHVILNPARGSSLCCLHCGEEYKVHYPAPVGVMSAMGKAFDRSHARCPLRPDGRRCSFCLHAGHAPEACPLLDVHTIDAWLAGPDTGLSSKTIVGAIMGRGYSRHGAHTPADPSDFGRCLRLLKRFPELRPRLPVVAEKHPEWGPFVREWDRMTALFEREAPTGNAPELYAFMRTLHDEARSRA